MKKKLQILLGAMVSLSAFSLYAADRPNTASTDFPGSCRVNDEFFSSEEGGCLEFRAGLAWGMRYPTTVDLKVGQTYCEGLSEGGYSDWTLPTLSQLRNLVSSPNLKDHIAFRRTDWFWTSTQSQSGSLSSAMMINLVDGEESFSTTDQPGAVVCVRKPADVDADGIPDSSDLCNMTPKATQPGTARPPVWTTGDWKGCAEKDQKIDPDKAYEFLRLGCKEDTNLFHTGAAGCQDLRTHLEWSNVSKLPQQRQYAGRYCESLREGIASPVAGWRLPSRDELKAIAGPEFATRHFKFDTKHDFWTSSIVSQRAEFFSYLPNGTVIYDSRPQISVVLADGSTHGTPTMVQIRVGTPPTNYSEPIVATNLETALSVVCVRGGSGPSVEDPRWQ